MLVHYFDFNLTGDEKTGKMCKNPFYPHQLMPCPTLMKTFLAAGKCSKICTFSVFERLKCCFFIALEQEDGARETQLTSGRLL